MHLFQKTNEVDSSTFMQKSANQNSADKKLTNKGGMPKHKG
jgi:hypothetical protein